MNFHNFNMKNLLVTNLPPGIIQEELIPLLGNAFPHEFKGPVETNSLQVKVFLPVPGGTGEYAQVAVIRNVDVDISKLSRKAAALRIGGTKWKFYEDDGHDRNDYGEKMKATSSTEQGKSGTSRAPAPPSQSSSRVTVRSVSGQGVSTTSHASRQHGLYVSNLPFGITEGDFTKKLIKNFPEEFKDALESKKSEVQVFLPGPRENGKHSQVAVVKNIEVDIKKLERKATRIRIDGMLWIFHKDDGTARNQYGERLVKLRPDDVRAKKKMEGLLLSKPLQVISQNFMESINSKVFDGKAFVYIQGNRRIQEQLQKRGLRPFNDVQNNHTRRVAFETALDALQAIAYLNGNQYKFCDRNETQFSTYQEGKGLGLKGKLLNINDLVERHGFVPFSSFHENVFDMKQLNQYHSLCWRCGQKYNLLGVDPDLGYVAARCSGCSYDSTLPVMDGKRAYFWDAETFTRLFLARTMEINQEEETGGFAWMIRHKPLKSSYDSPTEFQSIAGPLLQEDWKSFSMGYKTAYLAKGNLQSFQRIEVFREEKQTYLSLNIELPLTDFWTATNVAKIGKLTTKYKATWKNQIHIVDAKAKLISLTDVPDKGITVLVAKMIVDSRKMPLAENDVTILPHPIKTTYETAKHSIINWVKKPKNYKFLVTFMDPDEIVELSSEELEVVRLGPGMADRALALLRINLNEMHREALEKSKIHSMVIIKGPPGTGKTSTASIIIITLAKTEKGHVLATAPSNTAANNIAQAVGKAGDTPTINIRVLRIFAKKTERQMIANHETLDLGPRVVILHEAVRRHPSFLNGNEALVRSIRQKIQNNQENLLTKAEEAFFYEHIAEIEHEIMSSFHVIVTTCNTACDYRLSSYKGTITSLIVDEASMLSQTDTMSLLSMRFLRVIIIGDDSQLHGRANSYSAEISRLGFSIMDFYRMSGTNIPWIMLRRQYRMAPQISMVVSNLSYFGLLEDDVSVENIPQKYKYALESAFKSASSSTVMVFDHNFEEERPRGSKSLINKGEIKLVGNICKRLFHAGLEASDITVLSLYEAQRKSIHNFIKKSMVPVHTVDSFQGKESNVIVLSMTRGGKRGIGFAANKNRLNVAISRGKFMLIILCNTTTFNQHKSDAVPTFLHLLMEHGDVRKPEEFLTFEK